MFTKKSIYMVRVGIIVPAKVSRSTLQNATSVASILHITESVVVNIKEETSALTVGADAGVCK